MGLLDVLPERLFRRPAAIASMAAFGDMLDSRAAFMAQKCIVEFCRVRAGVYWQKLFSEEEFQISLALARWRAYPPCYAMMAEMAEGALRPAAGIRQRQLPAALTALARRTFERYPQPQGAEEAFWSRAAALVEQTLEKTQSGAARPVRNMPEPLARDVFAAVPIHPDLLTNDYDYIFNNLRMNLLRAHEDLVKRADMGRIVAELLDERL
jgi:hypothetical protein